MRNFILAVGTVIASIAAAILTLVFYVGALMFLAVLVSLPVYVLWTFAHQFGGFESVPEPRFQASVVIGVILVFLSSLFSRR